MQKMVKYVLNNLFYVKKTRANEKKGLRRE